MTDYLALWRKHKREGVPQKIPIEYLWKDFEVNLSQLNRERVFDFVDSRLPKLYEDDENFRYADY